MRNKVLKPVKTFSWVNPKAFVMETNEYGKSVFTKQDIKKDEIVAVAGGYIMTWDECKKLPQHLEYLSFQVEENLFLGVKKDEEIEDNWRFNHSCEPNLGQRGQISLVAMRNIKKGEELTFDYATTLCRIEKYAPFKMKCLCGKKNCRGYVTDEDWKLPQLQKKYKGYFQLFIQKKIYKLNKNKR